MNDVISFSSCVGYGGVGAAAVWNAMAMDGIGLCILWLCGNCKKCKGKCGAWLYVM